jgi:hypothetical protein
MVSLDGYRNAASVSLTSSTQHLSILCLRIYIIQRYLGDRGHNMEREVARLEQSRS